MRLAEQLADDETTTRLQDAGELAERCVLVGDLAEHGRQIGAVEARVVGEDAGVALRRVAWEEPSTA